MEMILWVLPYAPLFLLVISLVITVHELGHYWVGWCGYKSSHWWQFL